MMEAEEHAKIEALVRPTATKHAQQIADLANYLAGKHGGGAAAYAIMMAEITLQTLMCTVVLDAVKSHSKEGEELIRGSYDAFKETAIARWHKTDILGMGKGEPYGKKV